MRVSEFVPARLRPNWALAWRYERSLRFALDPAGPWESGGASTNRATEANHVSVGVGDGALPFAVVLVPRAVHFDSRLSPIRRHLIGVLTVDVQRTLTRGFVPYNLGQVNSEVTVPVSEGIGLIVERRLEACTLEPGDRASHVVNLEDRLEPSDEPVPRHELQLTVSLSIQTGEAVVVDRLVGMRAQPDPPIDRR
jgi:hypothetical protein